MRILVATGALNGLAGTEVWTRTMAEFLRRDHDVHLYASNGNALLPEFPTFQPSLAYDLALLNHNEPSGTSGRRGSASGFAQVTVSYPGKSGPRPLQTCM